MPEIGDSELFTGPAPSEQGEMSDEQFREEMRRAQQQIKQLQQEEGHARAQDQDLAAILVQFLGQPGNTDLFLLISRAVAQDIPSELIITIISLIYQPASEEVKTYLPTETEPKPSLKTNLTVHQSADFQTLPPEYKQAIDQWVQNIHHVAAKKPQRVLESIVINYKANTFSESADDVRKVSPVPVQLSAFVLRKYLTRFKIEFEFDHLRDFMQAVFVGIVTNLETLVKGQKKLETEKM